MYGFLLSLLLPVFLASLVADKEERVLLMMQLSGLRMSVYWLVTYVFDLFLYLLVCLAVYITSYLFSMRLFTQSPWTLLLVVMLVWGHALIAMCCLLATLFSRARTASVVGYLIVIVAVGVSNLLNSSVFLGMTPPLWYMIVPPLAFYRVWFVLEDACIDLDCLQVDALYNVRRREEGEDNGLI